MVATQIRLDLNGKKGPDLWARLGESDTRQIVMHPGYYDPDGNWVPLVIDSENIFAKFRIVKPDNTFVIQDASLYLPSDPSIFVVTLPAAATQVAGLGYYDLRIGDGETPDTFLYSAGGRFIVDDDMITDEMINSVASVDGLVFPDDFLTSADLSDYATKEYVDDAIAEIPDPTHVYSTDEKVVGTWIDGRNVYEKTFDVGYLNSSAKSIAHGISNLNLVLNVHGSAYNGSYNLTIPYSTTDASSCIGVAINATNLIVYSSGRSDYYSYVTIQYIKSV